MKPYDIGTKTHYNYKDYHPGKGWRNWWEYMAYEGDKTSNRMKVKLELKKYDSSRFTNE